MEKENNNKGVVILLIVVIVILAVLCTLFATGTISFNKEKPNNEEKPKTSETNKTNSGTEVTPEKTVEETKDENGNTTIIIKYTDEEVDLYKYIKEFTSKEENKEKTLNLTVTDITIDGKSHTYKIENYAYDCLRLEDYNDNYNNHYIDNTKIGHESIQACYLSSVDKLFVIKNKYIGIFTHSQGGNYVNIYDANAKLVDTLDLIDYELNNDEITYHSYENEKGCYIETYKYSLKDDKLEKEFKGKEKNTQCNEMNGKGCSYQCGE